MMILKYRIRNICFLDILGMHDLKSCRNTNIEATADPTAL